MSTAKSGKIVVILGPTASGKTKLAVELAAKFNGEIVSADSRQVYRGMDVGTGKDLKEYNFQFSKKSKIQNPKSKIYKVSYHLIDVADPEEDFNLAKYKKLAEQAIKDILRRGKLPILAGGSGLYLQAVIDNYDLLSTKPDRELRKKMESLAPDELYSKLLKANPAFAQKLNNSDRRNKRRLIRYLEIQEGAGEGIKKGRSKFDALLIGLNWSRPALNKRIYERLITRLEKEKMVEEVKTLRRRGISWQRLEDFGLEYRFISRYLQGKLTYDEMVEKLYTASRQFAKKQLTWFRRWEKQGRVIHWTRNKQEIFKIVSNFLK